jgi:hypothetical protein
LWLGERKHYNCLARLDGTIAYLYDRPKYIRIEIDITV